MVEYWPKGFNLEISNNWTDKRSELLEALLLRSHREHTSKLGDQFESFIRAYIETFNLEEWLGRELDDLYGACRSFFLFLSNRGESINKVRVFNPSLNEDGWVCGRTVVLVACSDGPFVVDSIRICLQQRQLPIHILKSTVLRVEREYEQLFSVVLPNAKAPVNSQVSSSETTNEALIYFEVSTLNSESERDELKNEIVQTLVDVQKVVGAYAEILKHLNSAKNDIEKHAESPDAEELAFLNWLPQSHFTFLGYRDYDLIRSKSTNNKFKLVENVNSRLGIFERLNKKENILSSDDFSKGIKDFYSKNCTLSFSKSATRSNVHRFVYPDYVVAKKYNKNNECVGERRFLGVYTYSASLMSAFDIPILRKKVDFILNESGLQSDSHDGRNLLRIIKDYPKDEIFQTAQSDLQKNILKIAAINERHITRLILRQDEFGDFVTCLVFVPRDLFNTNVRKKIEKQIANTIGAIDYDSITSFSESSLARLQIVFRMSSKADIDINVTEIEQQVDEITQNWETHLHTALISGFGESQGSKFFREYKDSFPSNYQNDFDARSAISDIEMIQGLNQKSVIALNFYQPVTYDNDRMKFKVMNLDSIVELSKVVPILENLGLRVLGEQPYRIKAPTGECVWMHDFTLKFALPINLNVHSVKTLFESAFEAIWKKNSDSDQFNKLVLAARLPWREVNLLRAYANYLKQTTFNLSLDFIANTLVSHAEITRNLIALFRSFFDPRLHKISETNNIDHERENRLEQKILNALDKVENLNQDTVLRRYLALIQGTLRTNFFQKVRNTMGHDDDIKRDADKSYISLKFSPRDISGIPEPRPMFEVFVYSSRVEGVHLRGGKVSRGGLRWSDRYEDYRTEVLGLVKAQAVKNAVIVPDGAKGGFVAKQIQDIKTREERNAEGVACYQIFIKGLLDVTDNFVDGKVVHPELVLHRDEDDPYLVVAADKGTATFSDIANTISNEYEHWLGDAFASGGSQGYDHKGMGITARGAWVSVQRHFRERNIDVQSEDFSVIGIGDMAGDVFGNGMLLSEHICLKAAFNHLHIFIDPKPVPKTGFKERQRLFSDPKLTWDDYDKTLISSGGGVFNRSDKSIVLSQEMKDAFDLTEDKLSPNELIKALLRSKVDLLWNGGIGTYVKSSDETHSDVGDKTNDVLRINGNELRCKVIGEGGNLGFTQLGRIEFALNNGACNTDFIDNAAGVDCSDHEVNIKILLDDLVHNGDLTSKQRNKILEEMTDDVSQLVLNNNYRQTFALSLAQRQVGQRMSEYRRFMTHLESQGKLDRDLEFLPSDELLVERISQGKYLTRPELCVLISYAKVQLKEALFDSNIAADPYVAQFANTAFPENINDKYSPQVDNHRLHSEIVGTQVANNLINNLGITAVHRLSETTGASIEDISRAYIISRDVFQMEEFLDYIEALDHKVSAELQSELMNNIVRRVRRGTRWFLRNRRGGFDAEKEVSSFSKGLQQVQKISTKITGDTQRLWLEASQKLIDEGVDKTWALKLSMPANLFSGLAMVEASRLAKKPVELCSEVFFLLLDHLNLNWLAGQLSEIKVENYWQAVARESYIDDLEAQIRRLTLVLVNYLVKHDTTDVKSCFNTWLIENKHMINRWKSTINEVESTQSTDYAMFSVVLRELIDLAQMSEYH